MKTFKKLFFVLLISVAVFSCKKDKEPSIAEYPFAKETVDEGKANLEEAGQELVTEMQTMKDAEAGNVLESFANCSSNDEPFATSSSILSSPVFRTIYAASNLSSDKNGLNNMSTQMKLDIQEDTTFTQVFNSHKATYTWDITNKVWIKTASSDFKFVFPSKVGGTTNDASLVITYTGKTGVYPIEDYNGDLPATFNASIIVGGNTVFEVDFKASYNPDGMPTSVNYFIALYPYKYEVSFTYSASSITLRYHLTNGTKNIIDCFGGIGGNFSKSNIDNANSGNSVGPFDVLYNSNAYFQVFNIKLAGDIDFKKLYDAQISIYENANSLYDANIALVKEINNDAHLNLVYADSKQKIASAEAYYDTNKEAIDFRVIFEDGSPASLDNYFSAGFSDLITDLNTFIGELNNDYELGIDPVN